VLAASEPSNRTTQLEEATVREIMSHPHYFLTSISTLDDALYLFDKSNVGALPVIASDNRVIGILAIKNLLRAYKKLFGLGERGSALVAVEDDGLPKPLTRLVRMLENHEIRFTRLIRTDQEADGRPRVIYLRVHTFNMTAVHQALREGGFNLVLPSRMNTTMDSKSGG
jgi:acetoin utilization protein AcuB